MYSSTILSSVTFIITWFLFMLVSRILAKEPLLSGPFNTNNVYTPSTNTMVAFTDSNVLTFTNDKQQRIRKILSRRQQVLSSWKRSDKINKRNNSTTTNLPNRNNILPHMFHFGPTNSILRSPVNALTNNLMRESQSPNTNEQQISAQKPSSVSIDPVTLIESRGYKVERHHVTTLDGYILCIHRIVVHRLKSSVKRTLKPVMIQHGLLASSLSWVMNSNEYDHEDFDAESLMRDLFNEDDAKVKESSVHNSLAFTLADQGYDVWLANSRGNTFSANHTFLNVDRDQLYWSFSFHEMAIYDLPAVIKHILSHSDHNSIAYIGHSQGAMIMFALMSQNPQISKIVKPFVAMAPVAYLRGLYGGRFASLVRLVDTRSLASAYIGSVLRQKPRFANQINRICTFRIVAPLCGVFTRLFNMNVSGSATTDRQLVTSAPSTSQLSSVGANDGAQSISLSTNLAPSSNGMSLIPEWVIQSPAGTSFLNFLHYIQMAQTGLFAAFDFGSEESNLKRYGRRRAPMYDLGRINSSDIILVSGSHDIFAPPEDVDRLRKSLRVKPRLDYVVPNWTHFDYTDAGNASHVVNFKIVEWLEDYRGRSYYGLNRCKL